MHLNFFKENLRIEFSNGANVLLVKETSVEVLLVMFTMLSTDFEICE